MSATLTQSTFFTYQENLVALLPVKERPVSRLVEYGAGALSTVEILATLIGGADQIETAQRLITEFQTIGRIQSAALTEIQRVQGIGPTTAARLKAALELGRRWAIEPRRDLNQIRSPADAANLVMIEMGALEQEHLRLLIMDTKNRVLKITTVYIGNLNTSVIRVGELLRYALRENCASIIIVHNHPSGDPTPSPEDVTVTKRIIEAGKLLDIDVLDHLVIGRGSFVSMKERQLGF